VSAASGPTHERVAAIAAVGGAAALYSHFYDRLRLPPRPPGSVGLILGGDVLPMLVLPLLFAIVVLREPIGRFGFRWPGARALLVHAAAAWLALLPFALWFATRPEFRAFYPSPAFPPARQHAIGLVLHWLLHLAPQLFATEFLYRGFLLLPLARRLGAVSATALLLIPYVWLHRDKPPLELVQAAWAGVVLAWIAWRTQSFLPAFLAHWALAVATDWLCYRAING
jgi:membrane protease YdiL (CAAX protease family)